MPEPSAEGLSPQTLLELYRSTHYDLRLPGGLRSTVRIGEPLPLALVEISGQTSHAFLISAGNPCSLPMSAAENRQRIRQLLLDMKAANHPCVPGVGHIPGQSWRESFLLLPNLRTHAVDDIAIEFGQNAIVHLQAGQPARLRIYRKKWRPKIIESADIEWAPDTPGATRFF